MNVKSDCFIYYADRDSAEATIAQLRMYNGGGRIYLLADNAKMPPIDGCTTIIVDNINSSMAVREIARAAQTDFLFVYSKETPLKLSYNTLYRMADIASSSEVDMVYADHYSIENGKVENLKNVIEAEGKDAVAYLEELLEFTKKGKDELFDDDSALLSDVDDIIGQIDSTLYQLKELKEHSGLKSLSDYLVESLEQ